MKPAVLLLLPILCTLALALAGHAESTTPTDQIAHGAEKQAHKVAHPSEAHGEGHEGPKTYLGIPAWILKTVNMVVFLGLLIYLVRKPVATMFSERGRAIRTELEQAKERRARADQVASDIQSRLSQIEKQVQSILTRAEEEGARQKQELIAAAEAEAQKMLAAARGEVDSRLKQARRELTEYAGELAAARAEQILASSLTSDDRKKIFSDSVIQLSESQR